MPRINTADALYLGTQEVSAAYLGSSQVWGDEPGVPENTVAPSISGVLTVGSLLTANPGTWTNSPTSYAYQWQQYDGGAWTPVGTGNTYTPTEEDDYRVRVIATNAAGDSDPETSSPVTVTEAPDGIEWAGGFRVSLAGAVATHSTGGIGHAYSAPLPAGSVYFEIEVNDYANADARGGIWCADTPSDPGTGEPIGQYTGGVPSIGGAGDGEWWWAIYANAAYVIGDVPNNSLEPVIRWGIAYNSSTRRAWMRQVWVGGASGYLYDAGGGTPGSGDPAAGTNPGATFSGTAAARIGASASAGDNVRIIQPANHYGSPPSGFTAV